MKTRLSPGQGGPGPAEEEVIPARGYGRLSR